MNRYFLIDFDSTLVKLETLEVLADIALADTPDKAGRLEAVATLTEQAMNGELPFRAALEQRLAIINARREHLAAVIERLKQNISDSFLRNRTFLERNAARVFIVSSGFREVVEPVVAAVGLGADHVYANTLLFDDAGNITGFDTANPLAADDGKATVARALGVDGELVAVGDGWGDLQIAAAGAATRFYAFTENVSHPKVVDAADRVAPSFDEVLFDCGLAPSVSYPKNRIEVLLLENIHRNAETVFAREGYRVRSLPAGVDTETLKREIRNVSILGIRSKTHLTADVLAHAERLLAVGAFCIGTNQIDLDATARRGIAAFNAPFSNTRSVVELAIAEIILLMRNLPDKMRAMHSGGWRKSASGSFEVRGKTLGIVGYGNIGMQLSVLAEAMGMNVCYFDVAEKLGLGTARRTATLDELLDAADIVSVHVDGRPENRDLFGREQFARMKPGAIFLNLSRGHVVDIDALREAIGDGKIRGAGVDVFPEEPYSNDEAFRSPLRDASNVVLTPHIGGSTLEAQADIGRFVAGKLIEYINTGATSASVNFPNIQLPAQANAHRLIHVHHNVPGILAKINRVLADLDINIVGQYLKTDERIGYVITDIDAGYSEPVLAAMKDIEHTIRARILY
ncbi:MAG TPA: phosphoglycerate dehydrogenase [Gammaproteobacteria bacterium]|nr:phosphoglycerate dehydrogenase [Gammaproteobacteria bacterium]